MCRPFLERRLREFVKAGMRGATLALDGRLSTNCTKQLIAAFALDSAELAQAVAARHGSVYIKCLEPAGAADAVQSYLLHASLHLLKLSVACLTLPCSRSHS